MITRDRLQSAGLFMEQIYSEIETEILVNAARSLKMSDGMTSDGFISWRMLQLQQLGKLNDENIKTIAQHAGKVEAEVRAMIQELGLEAAEDADRDLAELLPEQAAIVPTAVAADSVAAVLVAYEKQAVEITNLINTTMLDQSQQVYLDILAKTEARVLTGQLTPQQALTVTAREWTKKGIPAHIRKDGTRISTEAYVNMITRSVNQNVTNDMQLARMDEYDVDLVEISSHAGARPKCAPYQGRIFSRSGKSKIYPALSSTSYGEKDGLKGINCGHIFYPFVHGKSKKTYEPYDETENKRIYEESQKQRGLERQIRKLKKERLVVEALGDAKALKAADVAIRDKQRQMREFLAATDRRRRYDREKIVTP